VPAILEQLTGASAKRVLVILAAAIVSAWETKTGPHTWRNADTETKRYLAQLAAWGYHLADVERIACGQTIEDAPAD
jgi:ParB family transcriptional regulator, chromosome partitioning protein